MQHHIPEETNTPPDNCENPQTLIQWTSSYLPTNIVLLKLYLNNFILHSFGLSLWGRTYFSTHFVYINGVRHNIEI
jgi:hypothetical protein